MAPTSKDDNAPSESRVYATRHRGRIQNVEKKYDDIFSAVFKKTRSTECLAGIPSYCTQWRLTRKQVLLDSRNRLTSECDSVGASSRETDSSRESESPTLEQEDNESEGIEELSPHPAKATVPKYKCDCGEVFQKHHQLHEHIFNKHNFARVFRCTACSITLKGIRNNYVCRICKKFVRSNMDGHMRSHYQDRSGQSAFMECRCCYRTFKTIEQVKSHEKRAHYAQRQKQMQWPCEYCTKTFNTRHNRDAHLVGHVSSAIGGIWDKITKMQEQLTDQTLVNQCPICDSVMGSRKSFRLHVIHKHLLRDTTHFIHSMGLPTVSDILKALRANMSQVKTEPKETVKQEPNDSGYEQPQVKAEPSE